MGFPVRQARIISLAAALAVSGAALTACSSSGGGSGSTASGSPGSSAATLLTDTPKAKGPIDNLVWDLPFGEPTSIDYIYAADYGPDMVVSNLCESLLRLNTDFTLSPNLATAWTYSADKLTLTFTLRSDVTFWDGKPLTAEDAAYSLKRNMDPALAGYNAAFFSNVSAITPSGPHELVVTFKAPDELFIKEMATVSGDVTEKAFAEKAGKNFGNATGGVMCSGPFKLDAWNAGKNILLSANPSYWNPAGKALPQKVEIRFVTDTTALTQALKTGEIQGAYEIPPGQLPALSASSSGKVYQGKSLQVMELVPNPPGPATDQKVRQALSMVIDRVALGASIYHGAADANYTLIPSSAWDPTGTAVYQKAWDALKKPTLDLAGAKALLAGDPNASTPMTIGIAAGNQTETETAALIQQLAAQIGLTIKIKPLQPLEFSSAFYDPNARKGLDILLTQGFLDVADPLDYLGLIVFKDSLFNWTGYSDPQVEALLTKARSNFDDASRAEQVTQAQALYEPTQVVVPMLSLHELLYMDNKVTGAPASFAYIFQPSLASVGSAS
jgi:peptide/nickel transport system substrate-binding protein